MSGEREQFYPEEHNFVEASEVGVELHQDVQLRVQQVEQLVGIVSPRLRRRSDIGAFVSDLYQRSAFDFGGADEASLRARRLLLGDSLDASLRATSFGSANEIRADMAIRRAGIIGELGVRYAAHEAGLQTYFSRATATELLATQPEDMFGDTRDKNDMWLSAAGLFDLDSRFKVQLPPGQWADEDTFLTQIKALPIDVRSQPWVAKVLRTEADVRQAAQQIFNPDIWVGDTDDAAIALRKEKFLEQMLGDGRPNGRHGFVDAVARYQQEYSNVGGLLIVLASPTEGERRQSLINPQNGTLTRPFATTAANQPSSIGQLPLLSQRLVSDLTNELYLQNESQVV